MSYELSKNFRFESAHRLGKGYVGKCSNIHGHSWNGSITVKVDEIDEMGFAVDFKDLGELTKQIEKRFDHKILLHKGDEMLIDLCNLNKWEVVKFEDNPTCEVIARDIFFELVTCFNSDPNVTVVSVTIHETCTTTCTYYGSK